MTVLTYTPRTESARQLRRKARLLRLVDRLEREGVRSWPSVADALGLSQQRLTELARGAPIDDRLARELEWMIQRPSGWLDRPMGDPLDD